VSGNTATLGAGQSCSNSITVNGTAITGTATWTSGTVVLSGNTITGNAAGTVTFTDSTGSETCNFVQNGTWTQSG
jgi:hypothetical protein